MQTAKDPLPSIGYIACRTGQRVLGGVECLYQLRVCLKNVLPLVQNDNYSEPKLVCRQLFSHVYEDIESVYTFFQFLSQQISK